MLGNFKALGLTGIRNRTSLLYMLKILIRVLCSLPLVLLIYINIIYSLIYLDLMNTRMLRRPRGIELPLKTLLKTLILLLTGSTDVSSFLGKTYLWAYLTLTTFGIILSGNYVVVATYTVFYGALQCLNQTHQCLN